MSLLWKNSIKKIFKSFGRFISISLIIFIGIGVFVGLREATPGMLYTADLYYDEHNLMDFKVTSTYGLTEEDIDALKELNLFEQIVPTYSSDVLFKGQVLRLHAIEENINNIYLIEGRLPTNNEECLGDFNHYEIGDTIHFDEEYEHLKIKSCTVVGKIKSVLYLNNTYGISNIGDGKISSFIFLPKEVFDYEFYTEAYLIGNATRDKHSYHDEYQNLRDSYKESLQKLKPLRETIRYEEILKSANEEINKIKNELNKEINKNNKILKSSKKKLDNSQKLLNENKTNAINEFNSNEEKLLTSKNEILKNLNDEGITLTNISETLETLKNNIDALKQNLSYLPNESEQYLTLSETLKNLEEQHANLTTAQNGLSSIDYNLNSLYQEKEKFEHTIKEQEATLEKGYDEYRTGLKKLENAQAEANKKIQEAKDKLNEIEKPVWYLQDRNDISGYQSYKSDSLKVEAISKVLPIFFVIVVALMCLNTLTRLIEEERKELGILESNGFSRSSIILSYLHYVFTSTLIGITAGLTVGYSVISKIIYSVFTSNYYLPEYISVVDKLSLAIIVILTFCLMIFVTIHACNKELKDVPAILLRPKPPKSGKKIFLERFKKFWNKLSFMNKITIRNLFRYKKRIFMTILGVSGCTALLITGFGLNDSINIISIIQYTDIIKYDSQLILKKEITEISPQIKTLFNDNNIKDYLLLNQNAYTFTYDNNKETVYVVVPNIAENLNDFISLKNLNDEPIELSDNGVIITEQMANELNVQKGDNINIRNSNNELFIMQVENITKNYIAHYIYMTPKIYQEIFNTDILYNSIITNETLSSNTDLNAYDIYTVNNTIDIIETFDTFIKSINNLIGLIIICACMLAFAVLYNLTIINVNERKREIATFKVLGFKNSEIFTFIYRETLLLTIIGSLLGLVLGVFLHAFVLSKAQTGNVLFLCNIEWYSYILSFIITVFFSLIVELLINKTLKKIDMIDSLKSVE